MKNRVVRAFFTCLLGVSLIAGNCGTVAAAEASKDETVFVKTNEEGEEVSITVSDELKNISDLTEITDISNLSNIVNVKGDEAFTKNGDKITWKNAGSNEIVYQGNADMQLPVGISLAYELDGKKLSPEELKGKSGHLKISVNYENRTKGDSYVPFLMMTAFVADSESISNITTDHGRVVSDGDRQAVIGYGVPGMKAFLK